MRDYRHEHSRSAPGKTTGSSDLTRREWFLRLGAGTVLSGVRGLPLDGAPSQAEPAPRRTELPPGLYESSEDHMTHAITSDDRFHPIPAGSETDFVVPHRGPFQPQFFTVSEFQVVRRLVALLLGEDAEKDEAQEVISEIGEWIDLGVASSGAVHEAARKVSPQHRTLITAYHGRDLAGAIQARDLARVWQEGLAWLSAESQRRWGKDFLAIPTQSQDELLQSLSNGPAPQNAGTRLFALLKSQVTHGFYTSRSGLKELDYKGNAFNAECPGCSLSKQIRGNREQ